MAIYCHFKFPEQTSDQVPYKSLYFATKCSARETGCPVRPGEGQEGQLDTFLLHKQDEQKLTNVVIFRKIYLKTTCIGVTVSIFVKFDIATTTIF